VRPTGNVTFFRTVPSDPRQSIALANYLYTSLHYKTAYIIDDTGAYGVSEADTFSGEWQVLGGAVLGRASVPEGTASEVNLLTHIAALKPDVIFFGGSDPTSGTPESITIRQQMLQIPSLTNTAFAGTDGIHTPIFAQSIGLIGGPVWSTLTPADPTGIPSAGAFVTQYEAAYGMPGQYSASGYDSAEVLLSASTAALADYSPSPQGNADPAELRKAVLANVAKVNLQGVTGPISFAADGDLTQGSIGITQLSSGNGAIGWKQITSISVP
jgi:branched-chain amino acid transport system substrate-binding protein